jgi:hypothetical protein
MMRRWSSFAGAGGEWDSDMPVAYKSTHRRYRVSHKLPPFDLDRLTVPFISTVGQPL